MFSLANREKTQDIILFNFKSENLQFVFGVGGVYDSLLINSLHSIEGTHHINRCSNPTSLYSELFNEIWEHCIISFINE